MASHSWDFSQKGKWFSIKIHQVQEILSIGCETKDVIFIHKKDNKKYKALKKAGLDAKEDYKKIGNLKKFEPNVPHLVIYQTEKGKRFVIMAHQILPKEKVLLTMAYLDKDFKPGSWLNQMRVMMKAEVMEASQSDDIFKHYMWQFKSYIRHPDDNKEEAEGKQDHVFVVDADNMSKYLAAISQHKT